MGLKDDLDRWAEHCDIIWAGYDRDVEFYVNEARKADGKVLELACGSGRIYLELLRAGVDACGLDLAPGMLELLKSKAGDREPEVYEADMRDFRLDDTFSLVLCPFRSFNVLLTRLDRLRALKRVKEHLMPGGRFILDILYPGEGLMEFASEGRTVRKEVPDIFEHRYHVLNTGRFAGKGRNMISWTTELYRDGGKIWEGEGTVAAIGRDELEEELDGAGFGRREVFGDFEYGPLDEGKKDMVWVAQNVR